jgi:hypothetical protein
MCISNVSFCILTLFYSHYHTNIHTHAPTPTPTHPHTPTPTYTHPCTHIHSHTHTHTHAPTYTHTHIHSHPRTHSVLSLISKRVSRNEFPPAVCDAAERGMLSALENKCVTSDDVQAYFLPCCMEQLSFEGENLDRYVCEHKCSDVHTNTRIYLNHAHTYTHMHACKYIYTHTRFATTPISMHQTRAQQAVGQLSCRLFPVPPSSSHHWRSVCLRSQAGATHKRVLQAILEYAHRESPGTPHRIARINH